MGTLSSDPNASKESHPEIDLSYDGAWAMDPELVDGLYDFGISVFNSSNDQVSTNSKGEGWSMVVPEEKGKRELSEEVKQEERWEKVERLRKSVRKKSDEELNEKEIENILE